MIRATDCMLVCLQIQPHVLRNELGRYLGYVSDHTIGVLYELGNNCYFDLGEHHRRQVSTLPS